MGYEMTRFPLGPVFALQGRYVRRVTPRLPEAPGLRAGTITLDDLQQLATDGMHPSPLAYRQWSVLLAGRIHARWTSSPAAPM